MIDICKIKPPQSWCVMYPAMLDDVAAVGTMCTATATERDDQVIMSISESSSWALNDVGELN